MTTSRGDADTMDPGDPHIGHRPGFVVSDRATVNP
jgi:hypothetical protein